MNVKTSFSSYLLLLPLAATVVLTGSLHDASDEATKYARFRVDQRTAHGVVEGGTIRPLADTFFDHAAQQTYPRSEVELLPPTQPTKVLGVALNYRSHTGQLEENPENIPDTLQLFFKSPSSVIGANDEIEIPEGAENVHYEAEMVIVIGKEAEDVPVEEAGEYVLGVTCGNDVTARGWQTQDMQWWRGKGADTFAPVGPYVVSGLDYNSLDIEVRLNGEVQQSSNTRLMARDVEEIVSFASQYTTLKPGDLIYTGATGITSEIEPGDVVEVDLEGVGVLRNRVVAEE
jgi:2-keto-4-pentenoate hydratase/2-oxohepta-3-ene-1,7-dioic acid hydratase in catechol pathway